MESVLLKILVRVSFIAMHALLFDTGIVRLRTIIFPRLIIVFSRFISYWLVVTMVTDVAVDKIPRGSEYSVLDDLHRSTDM